MSQRKQHAPAFKANGVLPNVPSVVVRISAVLHCSPTVGRRKLDFPGCLTMTGW